MEHNNKRAFPYHSDVSSIEIKRRRLSVDPSREYQEPRVFNAGQQIVYDQPVGTEFSTVNAGIAQVATSSTPWSQQTQLPGYMLFLALVCMSW